MLELNENPGFQRAQLRVARVAVVLFLVVIVLALLGLFGSGPLSHATAGAPGGSVSVDYQRFLRLGHLTEVAVHLPAGRGTTTLAIDQGYLGGFEVGRILPEPDTQTSRGGRLELTYEDRGPRLVRVDLTPYTIGLRRAGLAVDGRRVSFRQLVYP
jgi:hypothetical protein